MLKADSIREHLFEEKYNNKAIRRVPPIFKQKKNKPMERGVRM